MSAPPLEGVRVIEFAGLGPGPYAGMMLADLGADVIKVDRIGGRPPLFAASRSTDVLDRGKRSVEIDLKASDGREMALRLIATADGLIEGFRPGVTERLGVGPAEALAANSRLVYGRITGWGQDGPLSATAGHDIDYLAVSGALGAIGDEQPVVPLNLIADFGGGAMFLLAGVLSGIISARSTGVGTVVDAAMVDGVAHLTSMMHGGIAAGWWTPRRHSNPLDGAAPFYTVYRTADSEFMAVGALEPEFFAVLLRGLSLTEAWQDRQYDTGSWPQMRRDFEDAFATRTRSEWSEAFAETDACVAPVMSLSEAGEHPHLAARRTFRVVDGVSQPSPAPRFAGYEPTTKPPPEFGSDTASILKELGYTAEELVELSSSGVIG